jgi:hypothetical protein
MKTTKTRRIKWNRHGSKNSRYEGFQTAGLARSAERFDDALEYFQSLYTQVGEPVRFYPDIEAFEKAYLEGE